MILRILPVISISLLIACASGCGAHRFCCSYDSGTGCPVDHGHVVTPPESLPTSDLVSFEAVNRELPSQRTTGEFNLLSFSDCQCAAASNAATANLLEREAQLADVLIENRLEKAACAQQLQRDLIMFRSLENRTEMAATAAIAFYNLALVETLQSLLDDSLGEIAEAHHQAEQLRAEALVDSEVVEQLKRQQAEMHEKLAELLLNRIRLNGQLRIVLDCRLDSPFPYWPQANLHASLETIDKELEVSDGLATRPDLRALRLTLCRLDKTTLPIARGVLGVADASLGTVVAGGSRLRNLTERDLVDYEITVRENQLQAMLHQREQQVIAQILDAAWKIETVQRHVALASEKLASRRREVQRTEQLREVSDASVLDVKQARLQVDQAVADFIQAIVALRLAEVELKRAKGSLAGECGFEWTPCCDGI